LVELLAGDVAQRDQRLAQAVLLEVAGREHDPSVVEEEGLDRLAGLDLEVAAGARGGQGAEGFRDGSAAEVGGHEDPGISTPAPARRAAFPRPVTRTTTDLEWLLRPGEEARGTCRAP